MGDRFSANLGSSSSLSRGGQVKCQSGLQQQPQPWGTGLVPIWAPAAASAVGDRFSAGLGSSSGLSRGGQVYEAIWAPAADSAMGDRFMKQSGLQQQPQPWGTGL
ncbi:hypothetical protein DPMN_151566 [Dreissena polymorpha]|uniref:Uncharacterized protein n=1 Tax=Dreissena polymorpha TaxID=45954 RepID=A0A9D4J330_DREPO|nr:hypothetical protein DPMN_151566 [Dreissena polymorpha]